jgi:hypothetical protein
MPYNTFSDRVREETLGFLKPILLRQYSEKKLSALASKRTRALSSNGRCRMRLLCFVGLIAFIGCEKQQTTEAAQAPAPVKVALDTVSEERAWELVGKFVIVRLVIAKPA